MSILILNTHMLSILLTFMILLPSIPRLLTNFICIELFVAFLFEFNFHAMSM